MLSSLRRVRFRGSVQDLGISRRRFGGGLHPPQKGFGIVLKNFHALKAAKLRHFALMKNLGEPLSSVQQGETDQALLLARASSI
ncbi:hypothetical protein A2890_02840 [candidate division WWE3 bacterium RIFCSPLOWO2_01_FULL_53_14]|uniref:Uncharacterized protein n=1 Tax=candidate division WWE3 bacterium RIFCSPLOWO2_01_FULL_53_14 TaxID=1802628 RepID=A0A1F4VVN3_UNCKA|nr:MAG: hypothetical protein A2890_02840 [candidate division WWE3 bacterium RIFCSPLOWO2_01_FULL_53_14]